MSAARMVKTKRSKDGEETESVRYFITSLTDSLESGHYFQGRFCTHEKR